MASVLLSEAEKTFILHGVEDNLRADGRARGDLRPLVLETGVVSHASGSCHLRLANTDILVGVKTELEAPLPGQPGQGRLEFFVDCSANATPSFEGRGGESLATSISGRLLHSHWSGSVEILSSDWLDHDVALLCHEDTVQGSRQPKPSTREFGTK